MKVSENRALRRIFEPKRDEIIRGWRKLHNVGLHNLHSSSSIIRMIKSRRMRWAAHIAHMRRRRMHGGFLGEIQKERGHCGNLDMGEEIILRWILEKYDGVVRAGLIRLRAGNSGGLL
jgi:hypothetical protein